MGRFAHSQRSQRQKYAHEDRYRFFKRSRHGERVPLKDAIKRQHRNPAPTNSRFQCLHCGSGRHMERNCPRGGYCQRGVNGEIVALGSRPRCFCCGNRDHVIRIQNRDEIKEFMHTSENCPYRHPDSHRKVDGNCDACGRRLQRCWNCAQTICARTWLRGRSSSCYGHLLNGCPKSRYNPFRGGVVNETDLLYNWKPPREERVPTAGVKRGIHSRLSQQHTHHHQYANAVQNLLGYQGRSRSEKWKLERDLLIVLEQMENLNMDSDDEVVINADKLPVKEENFDPDEPDYKRQSTSSAARNGYKPPTFGSFDAAIDVKGDQQKQTASKEADFDGDSASEKPQFPQHRPNSLLLLVPDRPSVHHFRGAQPAAADEQANLVNGGDLQLNVPRRAESQEDEEQMEILGEDDILGQNVQEIEENTPENEQQQNEEEILNAIELPPAELELEFVEEVHRREYKMLPPMKRECDANNAGPKQWQTVTIESEVAGWELQQTRSQKEALLHPVKKEEPREADDEEQQPTTSNARRNVTPEPVAPTKMYLRHRDKPICYAENGRKRQGK